ncbi:exosome complex component RRP40 [Hetaerina americana]|uniref:exosome complex component RRP40 n=1 Tax=Hetaerina americana TaxID=62018 RepID=UPI003A7F368E
MLIKVGDIVMPGDIVDEISRVKTETKCILGPGLRRYSENVIVCKSGIMRKKNPNTFWVDSHQRRYIPVRGESVVGVIVNKSVEIFKVDIGASEFASLAYTSFEGATKKNRPDVKLGDVIFAKLKVASMDMEPELECVDSRGKQAGMGVVADDGFLFSCSINVVRKILSPKCPLLKTLGREVPHEIAIGMNGKVWLKARSPRETIALMNAILAVEYISNEETIEMCAKIVKSLKRCT